MHVMGVVLIVVSTMLSDTFLRLDTLNNCIIFKLSLTAPTLGYVLH